MKILIFDASSLITLSMNCLTSILSDLKKKFGGKFIITKSVKYETVDKPLQIKRFELEALRINELIKNNIVEPPSSVGIDEDKIREKARDLVKRINYSYIARGEFMNILHEGELSCIALSLLASEKGMENVIVIDERTTRMIIEKPENLRRLFEIKLHTKVQLKDDLSFLKKIKIIRSSEIAYTAFKQGLIPLKNGNVLDALLYATKFKGCSISGQEIEEAKRL